MVADPWILRMGNQVSANLKHALLLDPSNRRRCAKSKETIGILSFEVANVMSKTVHLYKSFTDSEISKLKDEILNSEGILNLVSSDEGHLLALSVAEKLEELDRVAAVVSRLGRKCTVPALQGFEHVYGDIVSGVIDVRDLGFLVKDMEAMARRMERYVQATSKLYGDLELLNEMERASKKFQQNQPEESRRALLQKLEWQMQGVNHLKSLSLWDQSFDKAVELLARTVCTIFARICAVFGEFDSNPNSGLIVVHQVSHKLKRAHSKGMADDYRDQIQRLSKNTALNVRYRPDDVAFPCGSVPSRVFLECLTFCNSTSKINDDFVDQGDNLDDVSRKEEPPRRSSQIHGGGEFGRRSRLAAYASPSTVGGSALGLHYANVIIVIEKLLCYPHLIGEEARADLYQMLPTSLRVALRAKLKAYVKNLAIYDAPVAHGWKEALDGTLRWLAPLAHNMIRWQSERNFEQQQMVMGSNVLLVQTLHFADREKTEAAMCELLAGLNYICRYEQQQNALRDCASGFDFDDCADW